MAVMGWMRRSSRYFLAFVVVTFIASLAYFGATQDRSNPTVVATVNGQPILAPAYDRVYRMMVAQYREALRERFSDDLLKSLRLPEQAVERLVTDRLIAQHAVAEGLAVSNEELAEEITRVPAFQENGRFSRRRYEAVLKRLDPPRTPGQFEDEIRGQLLQRNLQALVSSGVRVSEAEARQYWETRNERVRVGYLVVPVEPFMAAANPSDAELQEYYDKHHGEFTSPERRRVLSAMLPAAAVAAPPVSDADLESAYAERRQQFDQPERRRVSHILARVGTVGGSEAEDRAKARMEEALQRIKGGADFAQVARETSDDTATKPRGGELGTMARGEMVKPFEELAFSLGPGEVGGPVRSPFGYHLIKVHEVVPASKKELKDVAAQLRATLTAEAQQKALRDRADEVHQALLRASDFAAEAKRLGLTVREIGPLARGDAVETVGRMPEVTNAIFDLPAGGVSAPLKVPEGYVVFRLVERQDAKLQPLADVRSPVEQAVRRQKATAAAQAKAGQLAEALRAGQEGRALAKRESATYEELGPFSRSEPLKRADLMPVVGNPALELPDGGVGAPTAGPGGVYVVKVLGREHPEPADFEKARREVERQLLEQKKNQAWQAYMAAIRTPAKITYNWEVLPAR
jgi:peptidyl-prolyl cis-trans isomerase D